MKCCTIILLVSVAAVIVCENGIATQKDTISTSQLSYRNPESQANASISASAITVVTDMTSAVSVEVNVEDQKVKNTPSNDEDDISPEIMSIITQFKTQTWDRREPAEKLLPLLKKGISLQRIVTILGKPDSIVWDYTLFYSSALIIDFDDTGKVKKITSDLSDEVMYVEPYIGGVKNPELISAVSNFKRQQYHRQEPARKLLPLLVKGMSTKEIETMLGQPDGNLWIYNLLHSTSTLNISISNKDKLEDIILTD